MKAIKNLFCLFLTLLFTVTVQAKESNSENLEPYRLNALKQITAIRVNESSKISDIRFERKSRAYLAFKDDGLLALMMVLAQGDNIDFTKATFRVNQEKSLTECYFSIRENFDNTDILFINLQECQGPFSKALSGSSEYGLRGMETSKQALRPTTNDR